MSVGSRRLLLRSLGMFAVIAGTVACDLAYPLDRYETRTREDAASDGAADGPGLLQTASSQGSNVRDLVVALPRSAAVGHALVLVAISNYTIPRSVSSAGVTWKAVSFSSKQVALALWVGFVPLGGSSTVTVTWPPEPEAIQTTALVHLTEWTGFAAPGTQVPNSGTGGGPIMTLPLSTNDGTVLLLAAAGGHTAGIGPPTGGFTALPSIMLADYRLDLAYVHAPKPGTYSTSWEYPSTRGWEALLVSFTR
jgi:hypothetical protein